MNLKVNLKDSMIQWCYLPSAGSCLCTQSSYCWLCPSHNEELQPQFNKIHLNTAELSQMPKRQKSKCSIIFNQWFTDSLSSLYWLCSSVIAFRRLLCSDLFWVCPNTATATFFRTTITLKPNTYYHGKTSMGIGLIRDTAVRCNLCLNIHE